MREFKFRLWDKVYERMFYDKDVKDSYLWYEEDEYFITPLFFIKGLQYLKEEFGDRIVIMQYTGLKDRNGRETYEGDILQLPEDKNSLWICEWDTYRFVFRPLRSGLNYLEPSSWCGVLEVVGNLFENPELLEK